MKIFLKMFVFTVAVVFNLNTSAEVAKIGPAYPSVTRNTLNQTLGSFHSASDKINNKLLTVLIRGEFYYILNHPENQAILAKDGKSNDLLLFEDNARSFLAWQTRNDAKPPNWREIKQNPVVELEEFWNANPSVLSESVEYPSGRPRKLSSDLNSERPNSSDDKKPPNPKTVSNERPLESVLKGPKKNDSSTQTSIEVVPQQALPSAHGWLWWLGGVSLLAITIIIFRNLRG